MSLILIIGNKNYSSWSMRAWMLLRFLELQFEENQIELYSAHSRDDVKALGGETGLVPVLKDGDTTIWDTLAITEYLYERHPKVWPESRRLRARARSLSCEVHSSLNFMRDAMPVNTRGRNRIASVTPAVERDLARVREIWRTCLDEHDGPWLLGEFCAVDIMFAPIVTRFQTYDVAVTGRARDFYDQVLQHPLMIEWLDAGKAEPSTIAQFELPQSR